MMRARRWLTGVEYLIRVRIRSLHLERGGVLLILKEEGGKDEEDIGEFCKAIEDDVIEVSPYISEEEHTG